MTPTTSDSWVEWKERCALGLCSVSAQSALRSFADARFQHYVRKYFDGGSPGAGADSAEIGPEDAWHLFETYSVVKGARSGKRYKEWLFDRTDVLAGEGWLDAVHGGVTLIMRDVVREYLRREHSPATMVSLQAPLSGDGAPFTLEDILPGETDPDCEVERREYERLAGARTAGFFNEMSRRERIVLLARSVGLGLNHPAVEQSAGCRKSVLSTALREVVVRIAARLRVDFAGEDESSLRLLTRMILERVGAQVVAWARNSENGCAHFFILVEGSSPAAGQSG